MPTQIKISTVPIERSFFRPSDLIDEGKTRWCFDEETETWRECIYLAAMNNYAGQAVSTINPQYFLCKWKKEGDVEHDDMIQRCHNNNEYVFLTCQDSFLFSKEQGKHFPVEDTSSLIENNRWRKDMFQVGAVLDVFNHEETSSPSHPKWVTCVVTETFTRLEQKYINVSIYDYAPTNETREFRTFCIESNCLAPLHTHTTPRTKEEIDQHLQEKYDAAARKAFSDKCLASADRWKMNYANSVIRFTDELPWYSSLRMNKQKTPTELILEQTPTATLNDLTEEQKCLVQLISYPQYDVAFGHDSFKNGAKHIRQIASNCYNFSSSVNGLFDIRVKNATYAYLYCQGNGDRHFILNLEKDRCVDGEKWEFTVPDITMENPLFSSEQGCSYEIETDGDDISTGMIYFNHRLFNERLDMNYYFYTTFFPSKDLVVLAGHGLRGYVFGKSKISELIRV